MKNILYILLFGLMTASCGDWLDVSPKTERPEDEMFSNVSGFKDALTGVYLEMIHNQAYGEYLTMSKIENLVNFWTTQKNTAEEALSNHNYEDAKAEMMIQNIYGRLYKVILATNAILDNIDIQKDIFDEGQYETIKGECLAIRAMCHFDVLRLFGPVPTQADESPILSYVTRVSSDINKHLSYSEYQSKLYEDLKEAEVLLKHKLDLNLQDEYFKHYVFRMNWYAVKALQARVNLWFGKNQDAYNDAMTVINATDNGGAKRFVLGSASDMGTGHTTLDSEHIFSLNRFDMNARYNALFTGNSLFKGKNKNAITNVLYGSTGTDIREMNLWHLVTINNGATYYVCKKYQPIKKVAASDRDFQYIPLIRLSEMYLIAIEIGPYDIAVNLWNEFLTTRNIERVQLPASQEERVLTLVSEYQKEFFAEGQTFYMYKRINLSDKSAKYIWVPNALKLNYVLPLPKTEIINN